MSKLAFEGDEEVDRQAIEDIEQVSARARKAISETVTRFIIEERRETKLRGLPTSDERAVVFVSGLTFALINQAARLAVITSKGKTPTKNFAKIAREAIEIQKREYAKNPTPPWEHDGMEPPP